MWTDSDDNDSPFGLETPAADPLVYAPTANQPELSYVPPAMAETASTPNLPGAPQQLQYASPAGMWVPNQVDPGDYTADEPSINPARLLLALIPLAVIIGGLYLLIHVTGVTPH